MTFSSNFLHAVTFLHVLHLDVLRRQIEIETESHFLMYGYNAGPPMAIPTVLCDTCTCTTEVLEIKRAASSVCLRRIVALCGLGVYECGLGVYVVRPGVYGVPSQQIFYSARPSRAKTGFPAHSVVQTGYTTPTLRFSDTLLVWRSVYSLVGVV